MWRIEALLLLLPLAGIAWIFGWIAFQVIEWLTRNSGKEHPGSIFPIKYGPCEDPDCLTVSFVADGYSVKTPEEERWKLLTHVANQSGTKVVTQNLAALISHYEQPANQPDRFDLSIHLKTWRHDLTKVSNDCVLRVSINSLRELYLKAHRPL